MAEALDGTVVVITGGGTGIGAATARRFAAEGAKVALVARRPGPITEVAAEVGGLAVVADASSRADADRAVADVVEAYGRLDIVVANAGGHGFASVADTDDDAWAASFQANVSTAFVMVRAALPQLIDNRGTVVIVSSLAGLFAGPSVAGYTVGKHALIGLTRSLARDYGRHGVRVNAVCPGWVETPMADEEMDHFAERAGIASRSAAYATVTAEVPLGRAAQPEEIASVIRFLATSESSYITGATLVTDGGAHVVDLPTVAFAHADM